MLLDEVPNEGDTMPFPGEDVVIMIYDGHPSPGMHCMSNLSPRTLARCGWGRRDAGM
jgi:hypothetical protein